MFYILSCFVARITKKRARQSVRVHAATQEIDINRLRVVANHIICAAATCASSTKMYAWIVFD